jgi:hypothetical protein
LHSSNGRERGEFVQTVFFIVHGAALYEARI